METIEVEEVVAKTDRAVLVRISGSEHWIPLSLIDDFDAEIGDVDVEISVAKWFLRKEGIE